MTQKLKVALIQSSLVWENPEQNRINFTQKINSISSDVDLIVLPEMFTTGFTMTPENISHGEGQKTVEWMEQIAIEKDATVVGSIVFFENEKYSNRLFFAAPKASLSWYDKRHTFTLAGEHEIYARGEIRHMEEYKGFLIYPLICYDLRFPVWSRNEFGYDILIYVANWPKPRIGAWDALLKARAIENMSYCIGVNRVGTDESGHQYSGHSAVYDGLGQKIAYSENEEIIYATLSKKHIISVREKLKFLDDRDDFTINI